VEDVVVVVAPEELELLDESSFFATGDDCETKTGN